MPFTEVLTKSWGPVEGLDKCSHDPALRLPGESTLNLVERVLGQQGGVRDVPTVLLTSALAPFLKSALEEKSPRSWLLL